MLRLSKLILKYFHEVGLLNSLRLRHVMGNYRSNIYLGKSTRLYVEGTIVGSENLSIDCRHGGQFAYPSTLRVEKGAILEIGDKFNCFSGLDIKLWPGAQVKIGKDCYISGPCRIHSKISIRIGDNVSISWGVNILDSDFHTIPHAGEDKEVVIGAHSLICTNVTILKGAKIGRNCVVAAGSILMGTFPDNCLIAGNPAKVVRELDEDIS